MAGKAAEDASSTRSGHPGMSCLHCKPLLREAQRGGRASGSPKGCAGAGETSRAFVVVVLFLVVDLGGSLPVEMVFV